MLLESIEAVNFRNLAGSVDISTELNIFVGDNGQGKTSWLEAIYLLASTRSFRTARLQEAVRFGENMGLVRGVGPRIAGDRPRAAGHYRGVRKTIVDKWQERTRLTVSETTERGRFQRRHA